MTVAEVLGRLLSPDSPVWLYVAGVLVLAAASIARRLYSSQARQGARIGALEEKVGQERIRRLQLESVLEDEGLRLPYWPPDGDRRPSASAQRAHLDDRDAEPVTRQVPAVPPFPPADRHGSTSARR